VGLALGRKGDREGAIASYRDAIRSQPDFAMAHYNLAIELDRQGDLEGAIASYREAIRHDPNHAEALTNLAFALREKGELDRAVASARQAIRIKPGLSQAHNALGNALLDKGDLDGAIAAHREAIRLEPNAAGDHCNLGRALMNKGDLDGAVASLRQAIRLKPDLVVAHYNLGRALQQKNDLDGAIASYREAIRLKPDHDVAYYELGGALRDKGELDAAIASYREAIRLEADYAEAHCNLGNVLRMKGLYAEALSALRRGHELGSKRPDWPYPSEQSVRECERLAELDSKLPALLQGEIKPADAKERVEWARFCYGKTLYAACAALWRQAFEDEPSLGEDLAGSNRYDAACTAALAGSGQGDDAESLDADARAAWRSQAVAWLEADLAVYAARLESEADGVRDALRRTLGQWKRDPDLAGIRDDTGLEKLPEPERELCRDLWRRVEELLSREAGK
jgi:tetratricopeptide (TPR) repeat protein